jgi:type IV secretory pathway VirB3-like protein
MVVMVVVVVFLVVVLFLVVVVAVVLFLVVVLFLTFSETQTMATGFLWPGTTSVMTNKPSSNMNSNSLTPMSVKCCAILPAP